MPAAVPPLRVLLVDDDPAFAELITCLLRMDGVEVLAHAFDGAEGVELALDLRPDVVVMDVRMPRMDGLEATRRILGSLADTAVLVVSSSKDPEDVQRALDAGAAGYLPKDRATAELLERLEQLRPLRSSPEARAVPYRVWEWKAIQAATG
ncbi:MAG TPA: response regulator transcription factor [Gaiellaceae bacterium]